MTFKDIAIKNFKGTMKNYLSFFLCNSFSIMLLFIYSSVLFNKDIGSSPKLIEGISKIMVVPNVVLILFSIFFINYAYSIFIKSRKREFGLLMNLGMSISDIRRIIIIENSIIAITSMLMGLISGIVFARLFFIIICWILGVEDLSFQLGWKVYAFTLAIFVVVYFLSVIMTIITTGRFSIMNLIKAPKLSEKNKISNPFLGAFGVITIAGALTILLLYFDGTGDLLLKCTVAIILGTYIFINQLSNFLVYLLSRTKEKYHKNILLITNIKYKFGQTKKIIFIITLIVIVTVFINGFYLNLVISSERSATKNNPFHISFIREPDKNDITIQEADKLVKNSSNVVSKHEKVNFIETKLDKVIIISEAEFKKIFKQDFKISEGKYIRLYQINDLPQKEKIQRCKDEKNISHGKLIEAFIVQDTIFKVFFNAPGYILNNCVIINNNDYLRLKTSSGVNKGTVELYNFEDWRGTQELVNNLQKTFKEKNENFKSKYEEKYYLEVSSTVGAYNENNQGAKILFYLLSFLGIFFLLCISIILYIKVFSDSDSDEEQYKNLFNIGITEKEFLKLKCNELKVIFAAAPVIAVPIAITYSLAFFKGSSSSDILQIILCDALISFIFILLEVLYYILCKRNYKRKLALWI
ncbi:ABC transporter permease [Clostridium folliculivorans]|uniref:ABC transporter permease n=1 Tax=Clostridium folliculivorans TaxID=2886038 RepID=A0A9W5Y2G9_9CLOT|nr:FtsX-like permease family protein [Clostridium folliculivorans]GKU25327.1 ABC transporter permease [Clostridium folliculivorans]